MIVAAYYTKLKGLWDELRSYNGTVCSCGADYKRRQLMQFLMGLNESYKAIRGQILLLNPLPDVRQAYASIVQEENQRNLGDTHDATETTAMVVQRNAPTALAFRSGQGVSSRSNSFNRKPLHCTYCDSDHHVRDTCWNYMDIHQVTQSTKPADSTSLKVVNITTNLHNLQLITSRKVP
jgi:hypothetical protein